MINLMPEYEIIVSDMVDYSEKRLSKDNGGLELTLYKGQKTIITEIQKRGYRMISECKVGIYDFSENKLNYVLPQGFNFKTLVNCDRRELQNATWRGFDNLEESEGGVETVYRFDAAPHRTSDIDIVIVDDKGMYACYAMAWLIPENRLVYLEPLSTVPEHRRKGLAAAALSELVRKTKPLGATHMTGGSNEFYFKIGYEPVTISTKWKRTDNTK